jgi:FixJ family two-component response regulator
MATQKGTMHDDSVRTVYLVDEDPQVRETFRAALAAASIELVAFGSAREYKRHPRAPGVACLIMDLHLPDAEGLEIQQQIKSEGGPPVIFVTGHCDIECAVRAMKAGAIEFLTKPVSIVSLLAAVQTALAEDRRLREQIVRFTTLHERFTQLTPREREVFPLIISGLRNKQAAWKLGIREVTLQVHRSQIMRKMAATSFAELVRMGGQLHILGPSAPSEIEISGITTDWVVA